MTSQLEIRSSSDALLGFEDLLKELREGLVFIMFLKGMIKDTDEQPNEIHRTFLERSQVQKLLFSWNWDVPYA